MPFFRTSDLTHSAEAGSELFDVGIVGGGPAGILAAIWSARYGHSVVLMDGGDPRNREARGVDGYLGLPAARPSDLRGLGRDESRIGMCDVWPKIPGLQQLYGANGHVSPDCDGYEARDSKAVVIGHGHRAVAMALALTAWTTDIRIVTNGNLPVDGRRGAA